MTHNPALREWRLSDATSLAENANKDMLTIAVECGYYDHTHLIKDFKTFTGETPTVFRN